MLLFTKKLTKNHYISQSEQRLANEKNPSCGILASV